MELLTAVIVALLGGYFLLQQHYYKWLLERGSEAFAKLLELIYTAQLQVTDILFDPAWKEKPERGEEMTKAYWPVITQARVVRLYLPKSVRSEFIDLVWAYHALHTSPEVGHSRLRKMDEHLNRVQELFEEAISPHAWFLALWPRSQHLIRNHPSKCDRSNPG